MGPVPSSSELRILNSRSADLCAPEGRPSRLPQPCLAFRLRQTFRQRADTVFRMVREAAGLSGRWKTLECQMKEEALDRAIKMAVS